MQHLSNHINSIAFNRLTGMLIGAHGSENTAYYIGGHIFLDDGHVKLYPICRCAFILTLLSKQSKPVFVFNHLPDADVPRFPCQSVYLCIYVYCVCSEYPEKVVCNGFALILPVTL